jgi:hypothetical protein
MSLMDDGFEFTLEEFMDVEGELLSVDPWCDLDALGDEEDLDFDAATQTSPATPADGARGGKRRRSVLSEGVFEMHSSTFDENALNGLPEGAYVEYTPQGTFKMRNGLKMKGQWTKEEDRQLIALVRKHGTSRWSAIARALYGRIGKQCRERWNNHLHPDIKRGGWTDEEEETLIRAHCELGNKWSDIARLLPGRTENSVKNHWNATKRRKDGSMTPLRAYVMEQSEPQPSNGADTSDSLGSSKRQRVSSPSQSMIKEKEHAQDKGCAHESNASTQDALETTRMRTRSVEGPRMTNSGNFVLVNSRKVPELHEPIVIRVAGNAHDSFEIINSHEPIAQYHSPGGTSTVETASYACRAPLHSSMMRDAYATLEGLIEAIRNHCPVVSITLSAKSGNEDILIRRGGNCFALAVSARKWEDAMQGMKLGVAYIKEQEH